MSDEAFAAPATDAERDRFGRTPEEARAAEERLRAELAREREKHPDPTEPLVPRAAARLDNGESFEETLKRIKEKADEADAERKSLVCYPFGDDDAGADACDAAGAFETCRWVASPAVCPRARVEVFRDNVHKNLSDPPAGVRVPPREAAVILASVQRKERVKLLDLDALQVVRSALTKKRIRVPLQNGAEVRRPDDRPILDPKTGKPNPGARVSGAAYFVGSEVVVVLAGNQGRGKCLGRGTPVMRYDGTIVAVEEIRAGDKLMGPDSRPRTVLSTSSGCGPLYRIEPTKGEAWVCNDAHTMTLINSRSGVIKDIALKDFLSGHPDPAAWLLFQPGGIEFTPSVRELPIDPYFLGVWFGDGSKALSGVAISKPDPEIRALVVDMANRYGLVVRESGDATNPTFHLVNRGGFAHGTGGGGQGNALLTRLRNTVGVDACVPREYLVASRADRAQFLAGWLDSDGYLHYGNYEIAQKRRDYAEAVMFLARSLGFRVTLAEKKVNGETYWRMLIIGDCSVLPLRIPRKKAEPRRQRKNPLRTGFKAVPLGDGDYYGFTLDGDGRFLLGDFTVTHNTLSACYAIARMGGIYTHAPDWTRLKAIDVDAAIAAPVLVIDQFGREHFGDSKWALSQLENVLDKRSQYPTRVTLLVGNLTYETFVERLKDTTIPDRLSYGVFVEFGGESIRAEMRRAELAGGKQS